MVCQAIETEYKGYRFRSRLEARWAVFFDSLREPWAYEVEGYELPAGRYLPDFWLPRLGCWLEIKGQVPTAEAIQAGYELAVGTNKPVAIAWGLPAAVQRFYHYGNLHRESADYPTPVWWDYTFERLKVFCFDRMFNCPEWHHAFWATGKDGRLCLCAGDTMYPCEFACPCSSSQSWEPFPGMVRDDYVSGPITVQQADTAKRARFEFQR